MKFIIQTRYVQWLTTRAGKKHLALFFILSIVLNIFMNLSMTESMKKAGALDIAGFYSVEKAYMIMDNQGDDGRQRYLLIETTFDLVYPVFYTSFYLIWIALTWGAMKNKSNRYLNLFYIIPVIIICSDYLENMGVITLLLNYPDRLNTTALLTSIASAVKWGMFPLLNIITLTGTVLKLTNR